jgi:hypothetical protein
MHGVSFTSIECRWISFYGRLLFIFSIFLLLDVLYYTRLAIPYVCISFVLLESYFRCICYVYSGYGISVIRLVQGNRPG